MIISNQLQCNSCKDIIFSKTVHDYVSCSCGKCFVDGGMCYLRRPSEGFKDMSIELPDDLCKAMVVEADWARDNGRNSLGYVCAIMRAIRDTGYEVREK